jgi:hypothetical protein
MKGEIGLGLGRSEGDGDGAGEGESDGGTMQNSRARPQEWYSLPSISPPEDAFPIAL